MPDFIILHGAPGTGKSTIARELHKKLESPWFEFGWIPEFRKLNPDTRITQGQEEQLSFENLVLVCKNYHKHGFMNVILTDLNDVRLLDIPVVFKDYKYVIITLFSNDGELLKNRIVSRDNGNEFRDWKESIKTNELIKKRPQLPNEYRINADQEVSVIVGQIGKILAARKPEDVTGVEEYDRGLYFSYVKD